MPDQGSFPDFRIFEFSNFYVDNDRSVCDNIGVCRTERYKSLPEHRPATGSGEF